jgi:hypothetical protein
MQKACLHQDSSHERHLGPEIAQDRCLQRFVVPYIGRPTTAIGNSLLLASCSKTAFSQGKWRRL